MKKETALTFLPGVLFLAVWEAAVYGRDDLQFLFAAPSLIFKTALAELSAFPIWRDCGVTLLESLLGLGFGALLGTCAGLLLWRNGTADRIARPYIAILGAIPVFAVAPIMIIWFGIGLLSKAVMAGIAVFFVSLTQSYEGAHATAAQHLTFARTLAASHASVVAKIIIPGSIRWVMTGFRINVALALTGAFVAEFISSESGLGNYILRAGSLYDMPRVLFGVALLSILALGLTALATRVQQAFFKS